MHTDDLSAYTHEHVFDLGNPKAERGTQTVMWVTAVMMVIEIAGGWWFNSMALLADGWHMSSHAIAIGLSAFAYAAARRYQHDQRFAFGTWKIEVLAGFASAIFLLGIAALMAVTSVERFFVPQPIQYIQAIPIAVVGLIVNVVCALILGSAHHHTHGADGHHHHDSNGKRAHDLNLRSAYIHVMADAATSVLAITALTGGLFFGWAWLDSTMGLWEQSWSRSGHGASLDRQAKCYWIVKWTIRSSRRFAKRWSRLRQRTGQGLPIYTFGG